MYLYLFTSKAWKFICTVCSTGIGTTINNESKRTAASGSHWDGGLNALYAKYSAVVDTTFSHGGFLTCTMHQHREAI